MANDKQRLELLMLRYRDLRQAQKAYFAHKCESNMKEAKGKEQACDDLYKQLLKEGYDPESQANKTQQSNLF